MDKSTVIEKNSDVNHTIKGRRKTMRKLDKTIHRKLSRTVIKRTIRIKKK